MSRKKEDPNLMLADDMAEFYDDPLGFVMYAFEWNKGELLGWEEPDEWQRDYLTELGEQVRERGFNGVDPVDPIFDATSSGHGIGKSALVAWTILWLMSTRPHCRGVLTANTVPQLRTKTWAELAKWKRRCITGHWFEMLTGQSLSLRHLEHPETWRVDGQTCREENSESFAGLHAANSTPFYIFDEASAVPDAIWEVAQGGLTDGEPMFLAFGNPTRNTGFFFDAVFGKLRHRWQHRCIDSRDCAIPNKRLHQQWIDDYGIDSDFVRVRVLGLHPNASTLQFIDFATVRSAQTRATQADDFQPILVGVDVARFGDDQSTIYTRRGRDARSWPPLKFRELDTMQLAAKVAEYVTQLGGWNTVGAVFIDGVGVGGGVVDRCQQLGVPRVVEVNGGGKPTTNRYFNKRAEMYGELKDWLATGAIPTEDQELATDLTAVEYQFSKDNRVQLEAKSAMKARLGVSPDSGDGLALTFAEPVGPIETRHPGQNAAHEHEYDPYN